MSSARIAVLSKVHSQFRFHLFDESKWKHTDEIDQDTPNSSASQFKEQGLKGRLPTRRSSFQKPKAENVMMIISCVNFFFQEVKNRTMNRLPNAYLQFEI